MSAQVDVVHLPTLCLAGQLSVVQQQRFISVGNSGATSQNDLGSYIIKQTSYCWKILLSTNIRKECFNFIAMEIGLSMNGQKKSD